MILKKLLAFTLPFMVTIGFSAATITIENKTGKTLTYRAQNTNPSLPALSDGNRLDGKIPAGKKLELKIKNNPAACKSHPADGAPTVSLLIMQDKNTQGFFQVGFGCKSSAQDTNGLYLYPRSASGNIGYKWGQQGQSNLPVTFYTPHPN